MWRLLASSSLCLGALAVDQRALAGDLLCETEAACRSDSALGLLQRSRAQQEVRPQPSATRYSRLLQLDRAQKSQKGDCEKYPTMCAEPFDCFSDPVRGFLAPLKYKYIHLATDDGHANVKTWCLQPDWDTTLAKYCIATPDLVKNAHLVFDKQVREGADQLDASYCFLEGHCQNMKVTPNTTLAEAEALCDEKYGHENWTTLNMNRAPSAPIPDDANKTGFPDRTWPTYFGLGACAMGNFHCDVIYCRETYCKMPEYRAKYEHFTSEYGWA